MPMHDLCIWHPLYRWFKSSSCDTLMHPTSSMWRVYVDILQCRCMIHVFDTTNTSGSGQVPTHISKQYLCRQFKSTRLDVLICYIVNTLRYLTTPMRAVQIITPWHSCVSCVQHRQWERFKSTSLVTLMCFMHSTPLHGSFKLAHSNTSNTLYVGYSSLYIQHSCMSCAFDTYYASG